MESDGRKDIQEKKMMTWSVPLSKLKKICILLGEGKRDYVHSKAMKISLLKQKTQEQKEIISFSLWSFRNLYIQDHGASGSGDKISLVQKPTGKGSASTSLLG